MKVISLNGERFTLIESWADMTLEQAIDISSVELPEVRDWFAWFEHIEKVLVLMQKFSTLKDWTQLNPREVVTYFVHYCLPLVQDLHGEYPKTFEPRMIDSFEHKGIKYLMPTNLEIGGEVVLQHGQNIKSFIEASNLLKMFSESRVSGIKAMPHFVACVVKVDRDEEFTDVEIARRVNDFKELQMDIFWEVFFCTQGLIYRHQLDTLRSMKEVRKPLEVQTLREKLVSRLGLLRSRKAELLMELRR